MQRAQLFCLPSNIGIQRAGCDDEDYKRAEGYAAVHW